VSDGIDGTEMSDEANGPKPTRRTAEAVHGSRRPCPQNYSSPNIVTHFLTGPGTYISQECLSGTGTEYTRKDTAGVKSPAVFRRHSSDRAFAVAPDTSGVKPAISRTLSGTERLRANREMSTAPRENQTTSILQA
jgi:hypothetical protein